MHKFGIKSSFIGNSLIGIKSMF